MLTNMTPDMAEFFGILLGDGSLKRGGKGRFFRVKISGNSKTDLLYYKRRIIPQIVKIFDIKPKLYFYKKYDALECYFYSKEIVMSLFDMLGIPENKLKYDAKNLDMVLKSNKLKTCFLRGFFDTDGTIYRKYDHYAQIEFRNHNHNILLKIFSFLIGLNFNPSHCRDHGHVFIHRQHEIKKFFRVIGSSNPKHIVRYLYWKENKAVPKISQVEELLKGFDNNIPFFDK